MKMEGLLFYFWTYVYFEVIDENKNTNSDK